MHTFVVREIVPEVSPRVEHFFTEQVELVEEKNEARLSEVSVIYHLNKNIVMLPK